MRINVGGYKLLVKEIEEIKNVEVFDDTANVGEVLKVGNMVENYKVGDKVVFSGGIRVSVDGEEYVVVDEYEVIMLIE